MAVRQAGRAAARTPKGVRTAAAAATGSGGVPVVPAPGVCQSPRAPPAVRGVLVVPGVGTPASGVAAQAEEGQAEARRRVTTGKGAPTVAVCAPARAGERGGVALLRPLRVRHPPPQLEVRTAPSAFEEHPPPRGPDGAMPPAVAWARQVAPPQGAPPTAVAALPLARGNRLAVVGWASALSGVKTAVPDVGARTGAVQLPLPRASATGGAVTVAVQAAPT